MEILELFEKFYKSNPHDFSEEEFEKIRKDIENPRKGVVYDEYVEFKLWSLGLNSRYQYFADYISERMPVVEYKKILEVGCGKIPRVSKLLAQKGYRMTAIDPSVSEKYISGKDNDISGECQGRGLEREEIKVNCIKGEFDFTKTDISEYDAIIAQEPCEATEHIIRACVANKKDFIIALCGAPHVLINGDEPESVKEWYDYLQEIGGEKCFITNSNMIPGFFCPVMKGFCRDLSGKECYN